MKRIVAVLLAAVVAVPAFTAEETPARDQRRMRQQGERGGWNRGGRRGFGRMQHNPRAEVEKKLKEQYPAEYAEIQKLRDEAEKKLQTLAKKANVELPALPKSWQERMAELKTKFPKEYAEYEALQKTDPRAAFAKLQEMMEKSGVKMPSFARGGQTPPPPRENSGKQLRELRKKYPAEFAKIQKIRREDPAKARKMTQELLKKLQQESGK